MKPEVSYHKILVGLATPVSGYSGKNKWSGPKI